MVLTSVAEFAATGSASTRLFHTFVAGNRSQAGSPPLQAACEEAYAGIFRLLEAQGLPHLWRVWNYMADINGSSHGLERYRHFNVGRQDAFLAALRRVRGQVPAACALGLAAGPLSIAFLAGACPVRPIENPRQVSAYDYPEDYGPRSPTFSRGALVCLKDETLLFISGTASIVGHRSLHPGDVVAQCRESVANVAAVLAEPVIGAGGVYPPAPGYLEGLRRLCDEHGAYLVFIIMPILFLLMLGVNR